MVKQLPTTPQELMKWNWADFEPHFQDLQQRPLQAETVKDWLADWSEVRTRVEEMYNRLNVAVSVNTADEEAERVYNTFFETIYPKAMEAEQVLKQKLLESGLTVEGFEIPLRAMRAEVDLFRAENLPLVAEETRLKTEYDKITGAQTVNWQGEECTVDQMRLLFQDPDRSRREEAWRLVAKRQFADREGIDQVWVKLLELRQRMATHADRADYRAYRWQELLRFDYKPEDAKRFHQAIEEAVVPAATRMYERRRKRLGVDVLRPWDLDVDPTGLPPLRPFQDVEMLKRGTASIFQRVDPQLAGYFDRMIQEDLLDLENRKNKANGGFCTEFPVERVPFIFMNAVGTHDNVQTLLHEGGHAFHSFEASRLPYSQQRTYPTEFAEVASMGMELLAAPYLTRDQGGFYTPAEAARARAEHLEGIIQFWPYMAVVDAFQHWAYENPHSAASPANCDAQWASLWRRFMPGVDWGGFEEVMATGWHRKIHIFQYPFYYIEYGLAQLGAVQVWANALKDQAGAVARYRQALALGGTVTLPALFQAAGARFAMDTAALQQAVTLIEETLKSLE